MASLVGGILYGGDTSGYTAYQDAADRVELEAVAAEAAAEVPVWIPPTLYNEGLEGGVGSAIDVIAPAVPFAVGSGGETDLAGETQVTTPYDWDAYFIRRLQGARLEPQTYEQLNPPQVVPPMPGFGGAYEDPQPEPGYDWGTPGSVAVPGEPDPYRGVPGTPAPPPVLIPPTDPAYWGAYPGAHEEHNDSVPVDKSGFEMPGWLGDFKWPEKPEWLDQVAGVVTPAAAIGVEVATDPEKLATDFGLGLGQTIAGIGGILILVMMMKD